MTTKNPRLIKQSNQTALRLNVTDLTPNQRQKLFKDCMSQTGFTGFVKHQDSNRQTHYTFTYGK